MKRYHIDVFMKNGSPAVMKFYSSEWFISANDSPYIQIKTNEDSWTVIPFIEIIMIQTRRIDDETKNCQTH